MNRNLYIFCSVVLTLTGLGGCSSGPSTKEAETAPDKIQGKAQVVDALNARDAALNAGGPTVYLWEGVVRYRLFLNTAIPVTAGKEYMAEGVIAQKEIDKIGDPDQGKHGYPLQASCERVVRMAWKGLPFDVVDLDASSLRAVVARYPARPVLLVTRLTEVTPKESKAEPDESDIPAVTVAADKQRALLTEGATVQPAPLWQPDGGTVSCKVVINKEGKISELETGAQLCEAVPWAKFRYQPTEQGGHPVRVNTEVEVRFEPRK